MSYSTYIYSTALAIRRCNKSPIPTGWYLSCFKGQRSTPLLVPDGHPMELGCCSEMRPWRHNPTSVTRLYCHSKGSRSRSVSRQPLLENHHMKYDKLTYQSPLQWCPGGTLVTSCHIFLEPCNLLLFLWNDSIGGTWWQFTLSYYTPPRVVLPPPPPFGS